MFNTYMIILLLFQYFGQRPLSRKKHALQYQLHSLSSTIFNWHILVCFFFHQKYIYAHYYNSNLIWRTVSRHVDEVIPSDPRYGLIHET